MRDSDRQPGLSKHEVHRPEHPTGRPRRSVSGRVLLGIYLAVPLVVMLFLLDRLLLGGRLQVEAVKTPEIFFFGWIFMGTPHIVASAVIVTTNREYRDFYKRRLILGAFVILALLVAATRLHPTAAFAVLGVLTVVHVVRQQVGIGRILSGPVGVAYTTWGWTAVMTGAVFYNTLYLQGDMDATAVTAGNWAISGLGVALLGLALVCHRGIRRPLGRLYMWANTAMILASASLYFLAYPLLAVVLPRIVHDVTAFSFYVVHDANRHGARPRNRIYKVAARIPGGLYLACPVVALLLTAAIQLVGERALDPLFGVSGPYSIGLYIAVFLTLLHYYTEAFTWKHASPYRHYVPVNVGSA